MALSLLLAGLLSLQSADAPAPATSEAEEEKGQITVTGQTEKSANKDITDRNHPDFVRCRSESVIGSRAKRKRTCMTNREWDEVASNGNRDARTMVEEARAGFQSGQGQ